MSPEYRSEFGLLTPRSSAYSPVPSSRSSNPRSPITDPTEGYSSLSSSYYPSQRPSTAPPTPILPIPTNPADTSPDNHTRSHSRLAASIRSFLSRSTLPSPSRFSLNSSFSYSETNPSSRSFHPIPAPTKWPITPRKLRPPNLDISSTPAMPSPIRSPNTPIIDAHRRYASEAVAKIYNAKPGSASPMSQDSLTLSAQNIRDRDPRTRNVLRRRPSGSAKLFKARERPNGRDAALPIPTSPLADIPLTPAGAVAEAYKQQELFRDHPPKLSIDDCMSPHGSGYDRLVHSPTPHFTAFRSSADRRMQPGSCSPPEADQLPRDTSRAMSLHHPSPSDSSSRSLTRKVSTKWRKIKGSEESRPRDRGHSKARPSLQELSGNDKSGTRSTGRSMDAVLSTTDRAWSNPIEAHSRPGSAKGGPEGGKFWRMMRRISTGGLRDQFQTEKAVPPVPAIPKDLLDKGERSNELVSTLPHQPPSPSDKDHTSPAPQNITSVAITSSSSNSSDVTSIRFFHKTHSGRSSVSSYGEAVGASHSNEISLDQHIIAPIEQLRLGEDHAESDKPGAVPRPSPRRSASVPAALGVLEGGEDEHVPLPSPRRQTTSGGPPSPRCSRPPSTSGSTLGGLAGRQSDGLVSLSPPPRPARNSRRGGSTASSPSYSLSAKQVDGMGARRLDRTLSAQSDMTARASPEPRTSCDQDARTHFTFRELGAPRRPPLSEREKVDIWNDLLDRSDRAGGTLHIAGTAGLMSDNMRFSIHSEV